MQEFFRIDRISATIAAATGVLLFARTGEADKAQRPSPACMAARSAVDSAHASERAGNQGEALESYRSCAAESGCAWLASKCSAKIKLLEAKLPSIVIVANDQTGAPVADVEVRVDGVLRASKLEGTAMAVTPGLHELTLTGSGNLSAMQRVMVLEGQHDQIVTVAIRPKPPAARARATAEVAASPSKRQPAQAPTDRAEPSPASATDYKSARGSEGKESSGSDGKAAPSDAAKAETPVEPASAGRTHWVLPRSPLPYTIGAVGLTGVAAGILTTVWGNKDNTELENQCSPNCNPSSQRHIKTLYTIADVSYGVGIAALGVATWMFASSHAEEKVPSAATIVDVHPMPSGALASVSGHF